MEMLWGRIAERRLQEAIDEGKVDNPPGEGEPNDLAEDMSTPPHPRVSARRLKNGGVLPDWMQLDQEIDKDRELLKNGWLRLEQEYPRRKKRALAPAREVPGDPEKRKLAFAKWLVTERAAYIRSMRNVNTGITKLLL